MIKITEDQIRSVRSLRIIDRFEAMLDVSSELLAIPEKDWGAEYLSLASAAMEELHGLRYLMASNKATDRGEYDKQLETAWKALRDRVASRGPA